MIAEKIDLARRKLLCSVSSILGALAAFGVSMPLSRYLLPSAKAMQIGGPLEVDVSGIEPGKLKIIAWRGKPVFILHRTPEMIAELSGLEEQLKDAVSEDSRQPKYAQNPFRSLKPEFLILEGNCTHLGCIPIFRPEHGAFGDVGSWWRGGFYCPCHKSAFDLAGRIYTNRAAPTNLSVPSYRYLSVAKIELGEDAAGA